MQLTISTLALTNIMIISACGFTNTYEPTDKVKTIPIPMIHALQANAEPAACLEPRISFTNPSNLASNVVLDLSINANFDSEMNPATLSASSFLVMGPSQIPLPGTVTYDAVNHVATFTPAIALIANTIYIAIIKGGVCGVKNTAGNILANDYVWTFTTGTDTNSIGQAPINLGRACSFAILAQPTITNAGATTKITGNIGLHPGTSITGLLPSQVVGMIHVNNEAVVEAQADLLAAYDDAVSRNVNSIVLPGDIGGATLPPGLYTSASSLGITGDLILDAQGNPNAVFIFQMGSTLTTATYSQVILAGGAKASNVFWQVGSSATLNTGTIFKGSILAAVTITTGAGTNVVGRLMAGAKISSGAITLIETTIAVPTP